MRQLFREHSNVTDKREEALLSSCNASHFRIIKYFDPEGRSMPNGIGFQRGNFLHQCRLNADKFVVSGCIADMDKQFRGGVMVFPADKHPVILPALGLLENVIVRAMTLFRQRFSFRNIGRRFRNILRKGRAGERHSVEYVVGHFFTGHYVGGNGSIFCKESMSIELNGLSTHDLLCLAEFLCKLFGQKAVLVKEFERGRLYWAGFTDV